jgi:hypothetical protein
MNSPTTRTDSPTAKKTLPDDDSLGHGGRRISGFTDLVEVGRCLPCGT